MREHRTIGRRSAGRSEGPFGRVPSAVSRWSAQIVRRPVDLVAIIGAAAASFVVIVNAIFLQSSPHSTQFFTNPAAQPQQIAETHPAATAAAAPEVAEVAPLRPAVNRPVQTVSTKRGDPIADLIGSSVGSPARVMAVQRVLAAFGYGQIKPTGTLDEPTSAAIEKFEGEHKLPVTGRLSARLLAELAAMTGRPLE